MINWKEGSLPNMCSSSIKTSNMKNKFYFVSFLLFSLLLCTTITSCRGKAASYAAEVAGKAVKSSADNIGRVIIDKLSEWFTDSNDDNFSEEKLKGELIISEESGDLIYIDESGDAHQAFLDDDGVVHILD